MGQSGIDWAIKVYNNKQCDEWYSTIKCTFEQ